MSSFFMIWAILKLYCAIGRKSNLREFAKQRMMIVMLVTYLAFLCSSAIYIAFYTMWTHKWQKKESLSLENDVFISWATAVFLIFCV